MITRCLKTLFAITVPLLAMARPASADWLLTGFASQLLNVETAAATDFSLPTEKFDDSTGFGISLASAFPAQANLGFEFDFGWYPQALKNSDQFGELFASQVMTIGTNFFFSPAMPRVRPYLSVGPSFGYRMDRDEASGSTPSGWAVGVNGGGGIIAFVTQRLGGRVDVRYIRNFGDFYDLREDTETRRNGWKDLQFIRVSVGATIVL